MTGFVGYFTCGNRHDVFFLKLPFSPKSRFENIISKTVFSGFGLLPREVELRVMVAVSVLVTVLSQHEAVCVPMCCYLQEENLLHVCFYEPNKELHKTLPSSAIGK